MNPPNRRIIVVTGQRTSSTYHCEEFTKMIKNTGHKSVQYLGELGHDMFYPEIGADRSPNQTYNYLKSNRNWVLKIIPLAVKMTLDKKTLNFEKSPRLHQFYTDLYSKNARRYFTVNKELAADFYRNIFQTATDIYYLYRKDFKAQVKSMAIATITNNFYGSRTPDELKNPIVVPDEVILSSTKILVDNWLYVGELYRNFPGRVITLEEADNSSKYPQYQDVQGNFNLIPDMDVRATIFGLTSEEKSSQILGGRTKNYYLD